MSPSDFEKRIMAAGIPSIGQDVIMETVTGRRVFGRYKGLDVFEGTRIIMIDRFGCRLEDVFSLDAVDRTIKVI